MNKFTHWTDIFLYLIGGVLLFFSLRWIKNISWIKDGLDKKEFAAMIFILLLCYMTFIDANRTHEWQVFSDLHYLVSYLFIAVGLGLTEILDTLKAIKGVKKE